jgi:hypothetical protein
MTNVSMYTSEVEIDKGLAVTGADAPTGGRRNKSGLTLTFVRQTVDIVYAHPAILLFSKSEARAELAPLNSLVGLLAGAKQESSSPEVAGTTWHGIVIGKGRNCGATSLSPRESER